MFKNSLPAILLVFFVACTSTQPAITPIAPQPDDILGIRLDMSRDSVRSVLAAVGTFEREERKRQEVWTVRDPRFSSLLIGYDPDWTVRYVTAIANTAGAPITYSDVLEVSAAERRSAGDTYTYTWKTGTPPHYVIAIGGPERISYLSLKKDPAVQSSAH